MGNVRLVVATPNAEHVIANAARHTFGILEPIANDKKAKKLIHKLIEREHFSPLEHATATVEFTNVSRAMTHQLVRHRLCSFTQKSDRYTEAKTDRPCVIPESIKANPTLYTDFLRRMNEVYCFYHEMLFNGIKKEDARYILPCGHESDIVVTANFREWRHIFELRGSHHAQWEIRTCVIEAWKILVGVAPSVFDDFYHEEHTNTLYISDSKELKDAKD